MWSKRSWFCFCLFGFLLLLLLLFLLLLFVCFFVVAFFFFSSTCLRLVDQKLVGLTISVDDSWPSYVSCQTRVCWPFNCGVWPTVRVPFAWSREPAGWNVLGNPFFSPNFFRLSNLRPRGCKNSSTPRSRLMHKSCSMCWFASTFTVWQVRFARRLSLVSKRSV